MAKTLNERTLVWAHRGACAYAPENTLESFALAVKMKADGVETDVHFSKDGKIMVLHDEKIDRTSNGQGLVTEYTLAQLKLFDFGCKFKKEYTDTKIPTLDELFDLLYPTNLTINIEVKSADSAMPAALIACAKKHKMSDRVLYSSFNHLQLFNLKQLDSSAKIAPLYSFNMLYAWKYADTMKAYATHPKFDQITNFPGYVDECHKLGIRVHPWTCDEPELISSLAAAGVDAVITNKPDTARETLGY